MFSHIYDIYVYTRLQIHSEKYARNGYIYVVHILDLRWQRLWQASSFLRHLHWKTNSPQPLLKINTCEKITLFGISFVRNDFKDKVQLGFGQLNL